MHHKKFIWIAAVTAAIAFALLFRAPAKAQSAGKVAEESAHQTVWNGIYTDAQASRGIQSYMGNCSPCHGTDLEGVAHLKGDDFMERWREFDARSLYDFISTSMPRKRNGSPNSPGSLSPETYLDIIAYIFRANSFPFRKPGINSGSDEKHPNRRKGRTEIRSQRRLGSACRLYEDEGSGLGFGRRLRTWREHPHRQHPHQKKWKKRRQKGWAFCNLPCKTSDISAKISTRRRSQPEDPDQGLCDPATGQESH